MIFPTKTATCGGRKSSFSAPAGRGFRRENQFLREKECNIVGTKPDESTCQLSPTEGRPYVRSARAPVFPCGKSVETGRGVPPSPWFLRYLRSTCGTWTDTQRLQVPPLSWATGAIVPFVGRTGQWPGGPGQWDALHRGNQCCWERLRQGCTKLENAAHALIFELMASDGKKINLDHICILRACLGGTRPGGGLRPPPGDPWFAGTSGRRMRNLPESEVVWSHFPQKKIRARAILM